MSNTPGSWPWVVAVHSSREKIARAGTGFVLDERRVLTSTHVKETNGRSDEGLFVAFPFADPDAMLSLIPVSRVRRAAAAQTDVAVLELESSIPAGIAPARVRCPQPHMLKGLRWWAFGFPDDKWQGNVAEGVFGPATGYGWVWLDTQSQYPVTQGFSGGAVWSPDYDAVIAVVGAANEQGDGQALMLHHVDRFLPEAKISVLARWSVLASDELAQQAWGWGSASDEEAARHWLPRARGVMSAAETGHRFRGRETALRQITTWLDRPLANQADQNVLIVTGPPGAGKSAVLGRIVVTADAGANTRPVDPQPDLADSSGLRATAGSVACAVHAKGKTALDMAREIARATSAALPQRPEDLPAVLAEVLVGQSRRFNLIIDALDEASDPDQARIFVRDALLPIAADHRRTGAQILVGTRRYDLKGNLLSEFGATPTVIDLDSPDYFELADLAAYAQATLQLKGAERPDNPYQPDTVAEPVAQKIAELAERNFLVAALVARTHGLYDHQPIPVDQLQFTPNVGDALKAFLSHLPSIDDISPVDVMAALAYLEAPGVPISLWRVAVHALTGRIPDQEQLQEFASTSAANFLVETTQIHDRLYRLFHQALNDTRTRRLTPADDESAITRAFITYGQRHGWHTAPSYLRHSLPNHAHRSGHIDLLLTDIDYTLHADLRRLIPAATTAAPQVQPIVTLLHHTPAAFDADPEQRLALFSVTEALDALDTNYRQHPGPAPYRATWANIPPRPERSNLSGHSDWVLGVCAVEVDGRELLASASSDRTVRLWDPASGTELRQFSGHTNRVLGVCAVEVDGRELLASASMDRTVRLWDPASGTELRQLSGHTGWVYGVCAVEVDGRELLASAGEDRTVRLWDPSTGGDRGQLTGHRDRVMGVCAVEVDGRELLASASMDRTVRLWDPVTGAELREFSGHSDWVLGVCAVEEDGRELFASASMDRTVRLWDPAAGTELRQLTGHTDWVYGVCAVEVDGRELLASASSDRTARLWDPSTGAELRQFSGHTDWVLGVCAVEVDGRELLASAGEDRTVRLWDPANGAELRQFSGHTGWVYGVCAVEVDGREVLASAGEDRTVRLWDPAAGTELRQLTGHNNRVQGVCAVEVDGRELLASASVDGTVRLWDPATGTELREFSGHSDWVQGVCAVEVDGREVLASASVDGTVRLWDPATGTELRQLSGHTDGVLGVCAVEVDGREVLASAGEDRTVRLWDPATGAQFVSVSTYVRTTTLCGIKSSVIIGLETGLLAIRPSPNISQMS